MVERRLETIALTEEFQKLRDYQSLEKIIVEIKFEFKNITTGLTALNLMVEKLDHTVHGNGKDGLDKKMDRVEIAMKHREKTEEKRDMWLWGIISSIIIGVLFLGINAWSVSHPLAK